MRSIKDAAAEFLACERIAVTGVSRNAQGHGSNAVYRRLRERGARGKEGGRVAAGDEAREGAHYRTTDTVSARVWCAGMDRSAALSAMV